MDGSQQNYYPHQLSPRIWVLPETVVNIISISNPYLMCLSTTNIKGIALSTDLLFPLRRTTLRASILTEVATTAIT